MKRIGDLLLTTPVFTVLREVYPNAEIHLATDAAFASLFPCLPAHRIFSLRRGSWMQWRALLSKRYDVCLDFNASDRSSFAAFLIRARLKVTYARFEKRFLRRNIYHTFVASTLSQRHTSDFHMDLLTALGIYREGVPLSIQVPPRAIATVEALLAQLQITGPFVIVHPGTLRPEKYWVNERWLSVIRHFCRAHSLPVLLTGSASPSEQFHLQSLNVKDEPWVYDIRGKLDLSQLAALISKARLLCGVDSAPVHMADAVATPSIALFGPTHPYQWRPRHPHSRVVGPHPIPYQPKDPGGPMESISADTVISAVETTLVSL